MIDQKHSLNLFAGNFLPDNNFPVSNKKLLLNFNSNANITVNKAQITSGNINSFSEQSVVDSIP